MIRQIKKQIFLSGLKRLQKMSGIQNELYFYRPVMEITTRIGCRVACEACPQELFVKEYTRGKRKSMGNEMSFDVFRRCIDKLPRNCVIVFSGMSEPFLNRRCADMMCYAAKKGHRMDLYTTLEGMDQEDFRKIRKLPFGNVVLHIPDTENSTHICLSDTYFKLLNRMLRVKRCNGKPLVTGISCHGHPEKRAARSLERYGVYKDKPDVMIDRAGNLKDKKLGFQSVTEELFCTRSAFYNHNVLLPDGSVLLCCMDYGMRHVLGNLLESDYGELMRNKVRRKIIQKCECSCDGDVLCRHCTAAIAYRNVGYPCQRM